MRKAFYIGIAGYLAVIVLAVIFYKERIIFSDGAFYLFTMVSTDAPAVFHNRFIGLLPQLPAFLTMKSGQSLETVSLIYSAAFAIYFLLAYLAAGLLFKSPRFALVTLFLNMLLMTDTFYWIFSEFTLGIALLMVLFAALDRDRPGYRPWQVWVTGLLLLPFIVYAHPLLFVPLCYTLAFFLLSRHSPTERKNLLILGAVYVLAYVVKSVVTTDPYDKGGGHGLRNFVTLFPDYFSTYAMRNMMGNLVTKYYWIPVFGLAVVGHYLYSRQWIKLCLFLSSMAGYIMLINITYPTDQTGDFYYENMYLPVSVFLALPFLFDLVPAIRKAWLAPAAVAVIVLSCLLRVWIHAPAYQERLDWQRRFTAAHLDEKIVVHTSLVPRGTLMTEWSTPYEFWALSTMEFPHTASILILDNPDEVGWATGNRSAFLGRWGMFPYSSLSETYFRFSDTTTSYRIIRDSLSLQ
ncbi:MAG: hypothetical protein EOP49_10685 [Sphingobacteriales bacterium]|nr:MAG: hypothetical protein EOP49_10685 [Sphingobacteriales bacterium]